MMPQTAEQWAWFVFYTLGSLGGWLMLPIAVAELWRGWRK